MQPFRPPSNHTRTVATHPFDGSDSEKESHIGSENAAREARTASDNAVRDYEEKRAKLDSVLDQLQYLVADLKNVNRQQWSIRYPCLSSPSGSNDAAGSTTRPSVGPRRMTYADDSSNPVDVIFSAVPTSRRTYRRTLTMAPSTFTTPNEASELASPPPEAALNQEPPPDDSFSILRLDLNLGAERQAKSLINRLEKASISSLLESRFDGTLEHLVSLRKRINDPHSRVLVTGDLNAGKSTLVNALLRRKEIMPTDEQPLTTRFVEVINAAENRGVEEVHVWTSTEYDVNDKSTFTTESLDRLPDLVAEFDGDVSSPSLTVYLNNNIVSTHNPSILHNNVVDISLIDAPGLNRDSIKTTANFARQEEIDVVVFVVSAANHFTLSAKEFIWQAGHEKAHLFIVVNRFDQIRDKERCHRLVLEQIKHLSPDTYKNAAVLVHFVDSAKVAFGLDEEDGTEIDEAFSHLEHSLRSFVLVNRSQSKLGPAQTYSLRLLSDIELLSSANNIVATKERDIARQEIASIKPSLDKMRKGKEAMEQELLREEEEAFSMASERGKDLVLRGMERIGRGELAMSTGNLEMPSYPGLLGIWDYARDIRKALLASIDQVIQIAEDEARQITTQRISNVEKIAANHLPDDVPPSNRQFRPENMFTARRSTSSASATCGLGLQCHRLAEVQLADIINLRAPLSLVQSSTAGKTSSQELIPFATEVSSFGAASLAVGTWSMLNGKSKSMLDSVLKVVELISSPAAKKWAGPIVGIALLGATAYIIYDLPQSVPRNIGRQLQSQFMISSGLQGDLSTLTLPEAVGLHTSKEVRKVMRLGAWAVVDRHRSAMESRAQAMRESQAAERRAMDALDHFQMVDRRVQAIRGIAELVKV